MEYTVFSQEKERDLAICDNKDGSRGYYAKLNKLDCSHEIKRHLLLGRKTMTKLGSVLNSRDITMPTKVHTVKAMIFPTVMYGCESWTIKKAEY